MRSFTVLTLNKYSNFCTVTTEISFNENACVFFNIVNLLSEQRTSFIQKIVSKNQLADCAKNVLFFPLPLPSLVSRRLRVKIDAIQSLEMLNLFVSWLGTRFTLFSISFFVFLSLFTVHVNQYIDFAVLFVLLFTFILQKRMITVPFVCIIIIIKVYFPVAKI